jgi:hypothetical protein
MPVTWLLPAAEPTAEDRLYAALGLWHTLAWLGFLLLPVFLTHPPWLAVLRHLAALLASPLTIGCGFAPVTLFMIRVARRGRRRLPLLDPGFRADRPGGLVAGRVLLTLGTLAWIGVLAAAAAPAWRIGAGVGAGLALLLTGLGMLCVELSEWRWRRAAARLD